MVFKTTDELKNYILSRSELAVQETKEKVFKIIFNVVAQYYNEFQPEYYQRTLQLLFSLVDTDARKQGNGFVAEVYFDVDSIDYQIGKLNRGCSDDWDDEKIINEIMIGGSHGGYIAPNGNTKVWTESIGILNAELIQILKQELIKNGIPVKTK